MRKDKDVRKEFIRLRSEGVTYRQIQTELNISRPTIAKWCRMYQKEIDKAYKKMVAKRQKDAIKAGVQKATGKFTKSIPAGDFRITGKTGQNQVADSKEKGEAMNRHEELQQAIERATATHREVTEALSNRQVLLTEYMKKVNEAEKRQKELSIQVCKGTAPISELEKVASEYQTAIFMVEAFNLAGNMLRNEESQAMSHIQSAKNDLERFKNNLGVYEDMKKEYITISDRIKAAAGHDTSISKEKLRVIKIRFEQQAWVVNMLDDYQTCIAGE